MLRRIRAPHHVEGVANQRHRADDAVERHVSQHACDDVSGSTQLARLVHDVERHRCGDDITDARYEAKQRIETEAHVDARQYEGGIEQSRQRV